MGVILGAFSFLLAVAFAYAGAYSITRSDAKDAAELIARIMAGVIFLIIAYLFLAIALKALGGNA